MVVDAVCDERFSHPKFPNNREFTGKFSVFGNRVKIKPIHVFETTAAFRVFPKIVTGIFNLLAGMLLFNYRHLNVKCTVALAS